MFRYSLRTHYRAVHLSFAATTYLSTTFIELSQRLWIWIRAVILILVYVVLRIRRVPYFTLLADKERRRITHSCGLVRGLWNNFLSETLDTRVLWHARTYGLSVLRQKSIHIHYSRFKGNQPDTDLQEISIIFGSYIDPFHVSSLPGVETAPDLDHWTQSRPPVNLDQCYTH